MDGRVLRKKKTMAKEYIERELLLQKLSKILDFCRKDKTVNGLTALFNVGDAVMDCPTADVVEVVHGEWISLEPCIGLFECSLCGHKIIKEKCNFCPNCGAKMDGKGDE
jgi:hypothetical protein